MNRIFLVLSLIGLSIFAVPQTKAADVSMDIFYDNLSGGNWIEVGDYGYGWQPDVAVNDPDWRPYTDGYWAYTDYGWTWISYEDFGWATYHYGRWARLADYGWVWFPGSDLEWGPAWVSWRFGGDRCGWAPLPPRGPDVVYEGRPIGTHVDVEFDIGPAYYNFIDIRYIGEPVLRSHIYAPAQNVTYINETVNVTNITVQNNVVYNYGPDYNVLAQHSERPIQRLKVEREQNVNVAAAAKSGALTKVQGDKLMVAAPQKIQKAGKQIAPPTVKTKIPKDKVQIRKGWSEVGDENAQQQLKQKIKNENPKNIPPPTSRAAGAGPSPTGAGASPVTTGTLGASPFGRGKRGRPNEVEPTVTPQMSPRGVEPPSVTPMKPEHGKGKGQHGQPFATPGNTPSGRADETPMPSPRGPHSKGTPPGFTPPKGESATGPEDTPMGKHKGPPQNTNPTFNPNELPSQGQGAPGPQHQHQLEPGRQPLESNAPGSQGQGPKHHVQGGNAPQGAPPRAHGEQGKPENGKHKKGEKETPPPG